MTGSYKSGNIVYLINNISGFIILFLFPVFVYLFNIFGGRNTGHFFKYTVK